MYELKPISREAIPRALERAERYRLLNEPYEAESICRDILRTEPGNQRALVTHLLALTDQFGRRPEAGVTGAREVLAALSDPYERSYYGGVICERWGKAQLRRSGPGATALGWLKEAMALFEEAMGNSPAGNEDAVLRWNACARLLNRETRGAANPPGGGESPHPLSDDEMPMR